MDNQPDVKPEPSAVVGVTGGPDAAARANSLGERPKRARGRPRKNTCGPAGVEPFLQVQVQVHIAGNSTFESKLSPISRLALQRPVSH